jgi:hypothetical protein
MGKNRRHSELRRRLPSRRSKARILIVCEGAKTEPIYLEQLRHHFRATAVELHIDETTGTPRTLVQRAAELKKTAAKEAKRTGDPDAEWDEVWRVFDIDEHPHVPEAREQAGANGIKLAVSNPNFELWALLHFQDQRSGQHRDRIRALLKKHLPDYVKTLPFDELIERLPAAEERAKKLCHWHHTRGTRESNPSTHVHLLVARIRGGEPNECTPPPSKPRQRLK